MKRPARPFVIVNFAVTADGKVSTRLRTPSGFTSPEDKQRLREIRSLGDAVLVGAGTVAADAMSMTLTDPSLQKSRRLRGQSAQPLRVIVSNSGRLDPEWKVFQAPRAAPLLVFSTARMSARRRAILGSLCDLWLFEGGRVDLAVLLAILRRDYRVRTLVCEGGPTLFRSLLEAELVDEIRLTRAPVVFGGREAPTLLGLPGNFLPTRIHCRLSAMEVVGEECFLTYRVRRALKRI